MKYLFFLFAITSVAQPTPWQGTYESVLSQDSRGGTSQWHISAEGSFEHIAYKGTYSVTDSVLQLTPAPHPSFVVTKKQGNSPQLLITLENTLRKSDYECLYIGYDTPQGTPTYLHLKNKLSPDGASLPPFKIPRTQRLYLVYTKAHHLNDEVRIEQYTIGKNTSAVTLAVLMPEKSIPITAVYSREKQTLSVPLLSPIAGEKFYERYKKVGTPEQVPMDTAQTVRGWEHLVLSEEDLALLEEEKEQATPPTTTLAKAQARAKKENRLLVVFYQPTEKNPDDRFKDFYELLKHNPQRKPNGTYVHFYEPYLATEKDAKALKQKGFPFTENTFAVFTPEGELLYWQEKEDSFTYSNTSKLFYGGYQVSHFFHVMALAHRVDKVLTNPNASIAQLQAVFKEIFTEEAPLYWFSNSPKATKELEAFPLKNRSLLYRFRCTPAQVNAQWARLIEAHHNDRRLDAPFASLIAYNYNRYTAKKGLTYLQLLFDQNKTPDTADVQAINYLWRFKKAIEAHNHPPEESYRHTNHEHPLHKSYINTDAIDAYGTTFYTFLEENKTLVPAVKAVYQQALKAGRLSEDAYRKFLKTYAPLDAIGYFARYYQKLKTRDAHIILALDKDFTANPNERNWLSFKEDFADYANLSAYLVYEHYRNDSTQMAEAFQWVQTALEIYPENPYYLNTMAHFWLYKGNREQALLLEEKAVKNINANPEESPETRRAFKENLQKMKAP